MEQSQYGLSVALPVSFDTAVINVTAALKAEGFGVLTTIDMQETSAQTELMSRKTSRDTLRA